jgi:DNA-binding transcriptional MerR regulator
MTDNEWMTVSEMSEKINIPVESLRRYIRSHNVHLKVKKVSKKYYLHDECVTVIQQIRTLYNEGKNVEEVEESLSESGIPMTLTVKNDDNDRMTVHVADELKAIRSQLDKQEEFNKALLQKLDEQQKYIEQSIERRDRQLMEVLKESQQARIEAAAAITQEEKKKGFFSRLFGSN